MAFAEPCISIPVQESDELVLVSTSELPPEPEDLLDLLRGEYAPLHLWLDFAKAYLANGQASHRSYLPDSLSDLKHNMKAFASPLFSQSNLE